MLRQVMHKTRWAANCDGLHKVHSEANHTIMLNFLISFQQQTSTNYSRFRRRIVVQHPDIANCFCSQVQHWSQPAHKKLSYHKSIKKKKKCIAPVVLPSHHNQPYFIYRHGNYGNIFFLCQAYAKASAFSAWPSPLFWAEMMQWFCSLHTGMWYKKNFQRTHSNTCNIFVAHF